MAAGTSIEWTQRTWNPLVGCTVITPGCMNCYAMKMAGRLEAMARAGQHGMDHYAGTTEKRKSGFVWTGLVNEAPEHIFLAPLGWKKPALIFVNSMSDVFHERVPDEIIDRIFAVMASAPQHTFQLLTKRAGRMREYLRGPWQGRIARPLRNIQPRPVGHGASLRTVDGSLPNVWLGASVEDQTRADARIPQLLDTPAAVRWLSCEPLLGPIDLSAWAQPVHHHPANQDRNSPAMQSLIKAARDELGGGIDWVVVGGESGPGARPMHPMWVRQLRDQCRAAGVAFYLKQWGAWHEHDGGTHWVTTGGRKIPAHEALPSPGDVRVMRIGKKAAGRVLDGMEHDEYPQARAHG